MADLENADIQENNNANDVIDTIKELKATTVAKDIHDKEVSKLQAERKRLLDIIKTGGTDDEGKPLETLKEELSSGKLTNLEFVKNSLELRNKIFKEKEVDIFMANGHTVDRQVVDGQKVADYLQNCVDKCEDNPEVFTAVFSSGLIEPMGLKNKLKGN